VGDQETRVLVDQLTAVDPQRLGHHVGYLTLDELVQVDAALMTVLGLD
jgi:mRNA interferase MazF